jgi:ribose-phosphate pyrophosphokinase
MKLMAEIISTAGPDKIFIFNIHDAKDLKYFKKPVVHLSAFTLFVEYFKKINLKNILIFSPDNGGIGRARDFAELYGIKNLSGPVGYCEKHRPKPNVAVVTLPTKFNVRGKNIILVDDMIDTAGTLLGAVEALHKAGAQTIYAAATHGVLSGPAIARLKNAPLKIILITDTYPLPPKKKLKKIKIISVAPILKKQI